MEVLMAEVRYDYLYYGKERRILEELRAFEHAKLLPCPYKARRWRPTEDITYKYDPNKSDTVELFADMTKWRQ
jgi:hypothetical protein